MLIGVRLICALWLCLVVAGCGGGSAPALEPPQEVRIIDADTVDLDGVRYRLHGIDAPESYQTCRAWGLTWRCGQAATEALMARAEGISCRGSSTDRYGRTIGVCSAGGEDLNAWLVANGWALAAYGDDYEAEEAGARAAGRGIHRGQFVNPADRRRGERLGGEDTFAAVVLGSVNAELLAQDLLRGNDAGVWARYLDNSVFTVVGDFGATSFGAWHETNPAGVGGATWAGTAIGINARGERVEGPAVLGIDDLARPAVDVSLLGFRWEDLPVDGGRFTAGDGTLDGQFYGERHREAGGVFERGRVFGSFGVVREDLQ